MNPARPPRDPRTGARPTLLLAACGVILIGLAVVAVLWGPFLWRVLTDQDRFKAWIESYEAHAALVFVAVQAVQVVIFVIPGEVTQFAAGYIFGTWLALLLSYAGITLGALTAFLVARLFERAALDLLIDRRTLRRFDRVVYGKSGFWPFLILFTIPGVPKDVLCYVAGLTPMHLVTFLLVSSVGRFPGVLLSCIFGAGLAERNWATVALSVAVTLCLMGVVYLFRQPIERFRRRHLTTREERELLDL
jgi:uncharacterized membrane protein YdjX (TVP38/TMEM64 family)